MAIWVCPRSLPMRCVDAAISIRRRKRPKKRSLDIYACPRCYSASIVLELLNQLFLPIIQSCYDLSGNWWVAIFLFTVIAKIVQFVLSLWSHKNGITMVKLMPDLLRLKVRYFGDKETIEEKLHHDDE